MPSSKIVIRDSIDEELSDDIEDDVFIRDGKSVMFLLAGHLRCCAPINFVLIFVIAMFCSDRAKRRG